MMYIATGPVLVVVVVVCLSSGYLGESAVASTHTLTPSRSELQTRRLMTRPTPVFHFATQLAPLEASSALFCPR